MPKNSGPTDRNIGLSNSNGKGDKSRITDVEAYRDNFEKINWRRSTVEKIRKWIERNRKYTYGN